MVGADNDTSDGDRVSARQWRGGKHTSEVESNFTDVSLSLDVSISPLFVSPIERSKILPAMENGKNHEGEILTICNLILSVRIRELRPFENFAPSCVSFVLPRDSQLPTQFRAVCETHQEWSPAGNGGTE